MSENQLYTSFRNEQASSTDLCDCANQDIISDLEKYGSYLDKIRAFLMPSLEYRIHSLLEEFVYSTNSRWAKQFPRFKKFIDTMIMWQNSLNRIAKYDIGMMVEMMRNIMKRIIKDDLITCFLDSIVLHHRLNKVCRELDALGIEENILTSSNAWNFVNERDYLLDYNCFTDINTTVDRTNVTNLNTMSCNAKGSIENKKAIKPKSVSDKSIEHITSAYEKHRQILDLNQNCLQHRENNSNYYSTCVALGSQNNNNEINKSFNEKSCSTKLKRNHLKLKIIVHKVYQESYKCSSFNLTRLSLPCKPSNLIRRIFEADSSLTESCLIVIKQKFENSMYNICSCLNSVLEKLTIKLSKALCLNCEIYPGYISFKLKASNIKKCLFVARVPICQSVRKRTIQQTYSILYSQANSKPTTEEINESKCFNQYKDNGTNGIFECVDEETEKLNTRSSQLNQSFIKNMEIDTSQNEAESNNEEKIICMITNDNENVSRCVRNFAISSCNNSFKDTVEEMSNVVTLRVDNSEGRNGEHCKVLSSIEINCDDVERCKRGILESSNSKTNTSTQLVNCRCLSYENFIETNDEIENIFNFQSKDLKDSFPQVSTGINEPDWICSSNKKSNEICNVNTCSITSFVQNSECDKQLVELNYNRRFSYSNINVLDERFDTQENGSSLNSAKAIGCNSCCSCRRDDFIDIAVIDGISKENIVCAFGTAQGNFDAVKTRNTVYSKTVQVSPRNNNLLTISVQMPSSTISPKEVALDTRYSRTVWSDDDKSISTVLATSDRCNEEIANLSTRALTSKEDSKMLPDKEIFDVKDGTQDFIASVKRLSIPKGKFRFNEDSRNSGVSRKKYLCAGNHSMCATSSVSLYRSFATPSEFTMDNKRDEFQKSKLKKVSKLRRREYVRSRNGNVTSIKHRTASHRYPNDYPAEIRPQTRLAMTKFRNSVDESVDRLKRLIRTKLRRILFNSKISDNGKMMKTFWRNKNGTRRKRTVGNKHIRPGCYSTRAPCSTCGRQGYTTSSRESSNVILSIRRTKGKRSDEYVKFRGHRVVTDGSKDLLSLRSIEMSPWFCDSLTSIVKENIERPKLNRNNRYDGKKQIGNVINNRNNHGCDLKHSRTIIRTVSSQSTKVPLTENDSKYFGHYTCKRQDEVYDNERICKQAHNQNQRENEYENRSKYRDVPIKCVNVDDTDESLQTSLSYTRRGNARNVQQQFYGISKVRRFASSKKNRQIFKEDVSVRSHNSLRKRRIFTILTDACNDYTDALDLDFKLRLLRYVEFCKSIKRSLTRTLRPDDIYEVSTASVSSSDL